MNEKAKQKKQMLQISHPILETMKQFVWLALIFLILIPLDLYSQNVFTRYYETLTNTGFSNLLNDYEQDSMLSYWRVTLDRNLQVYKAAWYQHDVLTEVWDFEGEDVTRKEFYRQGELYKVAHFRPGGEPKQEQLTSHWLSETFNRDGRLVYWKVYFDRDTRHLIQAELYRFYSHLDSHRPFYQHTSAPLVKLYWNNQRFVYRQEIYTDRHIEWLTVFRNPKEADTDEIRGFYVDQEKYRDKYWLSPYYGFYTEFNELTGEYDGKLPRGLALLEDAYKITFDYRRFPIQVELYRFESRQRYFLERIYTLSYHHNDELRRVDVFRPEAKHPDYSFDFHYDDTERQMGYSFLTYDEQGTAQQARIYKYEWDGDRLMTIQQYRENQLFSTQSFSYTRQGLLRSKTHRGLNGMFFLDYYYRYNEANRLIEQTKKQSGYLHTVTTYDYNNAGNLVYKRVEQVFEAHEPPLEEPETERLYTQEETQDPYFGIRVTGYDYTPENQLKRRVIGYPEKDIRILDIFNRVDVIDRRMVYYGTKLDHVLHINDTGDCFQEDLYEDGKRVGFHRFSHTSTGNIIKVETYRNETLVKITHLSQHAVGLYGVIQSVDMMDTQGGVEQSYRYVDGRQLPWQ
jgi:hypothetical protein